MGINDSAIFKHFRVEPVMESGFDAGFLDCQTPGDDFSRVAMAEMIVEFLEVFATSGC